VSVFFLFCMFVETFLCVFLLCCVIRVIASFVIGTSSSVSISTISYTLHTHTSLVVETNGNLHIRGVRVAKEDG